MKYLFFAIVVIGAVIGYGAKKISPYIFKGDGRDEVKDVAVIKLVGFVIALVGAILVFTVIK